CTAFEIADSPSNGDAPEPQSAPTELPCLWKRLKKLVSRNRSRTGRKLHVNDSKLVYSPGIGLKELERSVLAMAAAWQQWIDQFEHFISSVADHVSPDLGQSNWYRPADGESFPFAQEAIPVKLFANALRLEMERTGIRCL